MTTVWRHLVVAMFLLCLPVGCGDGGPDSADSSDSDGTSDGQPDQDALPPDRTATPEHNTPGTAGSAVPPGESPVPCEVGEILRDNCLDCHGNPTNWGAPMPLVSAEDFLRDGVLTPDRKVHELVAERIRDERKPMPSSGLMAEPEIDVLDQWMQAGMELGIEEDASCVMVPEGGAVRAGTERELEPLPDDAECYQFLKHGAQSADDTTPHRVETGETYVNFYYDVPWDEPKAMVRNATVYDRTEVLHHWLLYDSGGDQQGGTWENSSGSHIGQNVTLVAGWAVGGNEIGTVDGVSARVPDPGGKLLLEWHLFNTTGAEVEDASGVEVCVVPKDSVDPSKISGVTLLGTEALGGLLGLGGMAPGMEHKFAGTCAPSFDNAKDDEPITIFGWLPHQHLIGIHADVWVHRKGGDEEHVFSEPFYFDRQISYDIAPPYLKIHRGDTLRAQCTYFNSTDHPVGFGPSTEDEMCYVFAMSYPAGALDNGAPSLIGAGNTCWD